MLFTLLLCPGLALGETALRQAIADLKEETAFWQQACGRLQLDLENLEGEHRLTQERLLQVQQAQQQSHARLVELQAALEAQKLQQKEALAAHETRIVAAVSQQLQVFGQQTQRALDKVAQESKPTKQEPSFAQLQKGLLHTVAQGETLSAIARKYKISLSLLQSVNGIKDPNQLQKGQDLFIPENLF